MVFAYTNFFVTIGLSRALELCSNYALFLIHRSSRGDISREEEFNTVASRTLSNNLVKINSHDTNIVNSILELPALDMISVKRQIITLSINQNVQPFFLLSQRKSALAEVAKDWNVPWIEDGEICDSSLSLFLNGKMPLIFIDSSNFANWFGGKYLNSLPPVVFIFNLDVSESILASLWPILPSYLIKGYKFKFMKMKINRNRDLGIISLAVNFEN